MINTIYDFRKELEVDMQKCVNNFKMNINKIHTSRISSEILRPIMIDYHGVSTSILYLANIVVEQYRTLSITAFDSKMTKKIEKAILVSNIGLTPIVDRNTVRITLPLLTEDRRKKLIKLVRYESEKSKISVRNLRRIFNEKVKILCKRKEINEDSEHDFRNEIQNLTNVWINKIDAILKKKELELMQF